MISASAALPSSYDYGEVARSVSIAIAASYAALDLAGRVTAAPRGRDRLAWLSGGAIAMGVGIWTMHLKGMLAFRMPVPVEYHWPTVLAALSVAIFASAVALYVTSRRKMGQTEALTGSIVMGAGIAGLHYILMAAMRLAAITRYSPLLVTCSILLAILFSLIALLLAFGLREEVRSTVPRRVCSAIVMGAAISAMHYTGMAAASFIPAPLPDLSHAVSISPVGGSGVVIATLIVLVAANITSSVDRRVRTQIQRLNQDLERRVDDRTAQLRALNEKLADSEERFRKLVEALPDAILVHGENKILFVNPSCLRLLGARQPEQLLGKDVLEILHPAYRESVQQRIQYCLETGTACPAKESVLLALDGSEVSIEAAAIAIPWNGSQAVEVIIRDIRPRKHAEKSLQLFRMLIDQSNDAIEVIELGTHRFLDANERACLDLGYSREELLSLTIYDIDHDASESRFAKVSEDLRNSGSAIFESLHRRKNGTTFPVEISVKQVHFDRTYRICVVRDITERKRAEKSLQLFRMLIDQSNDAIEVVDPETLRYIDINERACIDLGYTREELLSMSIYDIDPHVDESLNARVHAELRELGSSILESVHRRKDGSTFPVEVSITQVNLDRTYLVSVARDITERKRVEDELKKQKEVFQKIFENIPVMIAFFGEDGRFKLANPEWERTIGWSVEEIQNQNLDIFVELYPNPRYRQIARDFAASLSGGHADFKVRVRSGRVIDMAADVVRLSDGSTLGLGKDITEQKRTEAELRESEARFRLVADSAPVLIWMSGTDKLCTYFNKPRLEFTGRSIVRELGNGWVDGVHPGDLSRCLDIYSQSFDRREAFRMEYRLRRHDGEFRWLLDIGVPRFNPDRSFAGYIGSCIDVTDQKRAEGQLRQTQADLARVTRVVAMGELVASIAHEINQPLATVTTSGSAALHWLAAHPPNLQEASEAIRGTIREATRASDVIGRIRALLQKTPPQLKKLDLNALIREVLILAENELMSGGVTVQTELAADAHPVLGDPVQLRQVLLNLILNAIDATSSISDRPREVFIKSAAHPDGALVQIRDSGHGIDPLHVERIFDSLFTTKAQGIGVGLSLSRSIVEAHGGRLWTVPQDNPGAVFEFTIPRAA